MIKILSLLLFILLLSDVKSQEEQQQDKSKLKYNPFNTPIANQADIWELKFGSGHMSHNGFVSNKFAFNFKLHYFYELNFSASQNYAIAVGIGYGFQQLKLNGVFEKSSNGGFINTENNSTISNNRLNINSVSIPIEFRIKSFQNIKLYFGYNFSFPLMTNLKYNQESNEMEVKNIAPISELQHGPTLRVGIKDVFLFARYGVQNSFSSENSNLFVFGVSLGG